MARFSTPGVYVKENNAFSNSVVSVPTAIPAFIGYTEKADRAGDSLKHKPTRIDSLKEYISLFGRGSTPTFSLEDKGGDFELTPDKNTQYNLFNSLRLFYSNGGGTCYIVSVGDYKQGSIKLADMKEGLDSLGSLQEPSMVVAPDAVLLSKDDCYSLYQQMLMHCGKETKDRFAIFDVYGGDQTRTYDDKDIITDFRTSVGNNFLNYGAAYYPYLNTNVVSADEVSFRNVSNTDGLIKYLTNNAETRYFGKYAKSSAKPPKGGGGASASSSKGSSKGSTKASSSTSPVASAVLAPAVEDRIVRRFEEVKNEIERLSTAGESSEVVDQNLRAISPAYNRILNKIVELVNLQPASGIMAGIYAMVDNTVGVHKAPANVSLNNVLSPAVHITAPMQEDLNVPINGKAVNAIRSFVGKGVLVWGARTLDGNSQDWRYINVRRTLLFIEQSVKSAVENYIFEPNTPQTWLKVKISIDNFLTTVWKSGALVGISPSEAYEVVVGLGQTMTPVDILDGIMRISVYVSVARPAEFIEITFEQKMLEGADDASAN